MADFAYVSSLDGKPKKWMADSVWYELGENERRLMPCSVADVGREFFSVAHSTGLREDSTLLVEPFEGDVAPAPVTAQVFRDDETGIEYETLADLIAAVKKRAGEPKAAAHVEETPKRGGTSFAGLKK